MSERGLSVEEFRLSTFFWLDCKAIRAYGLIFVCTFKLNILDNLFIKVLELVLQSGYTIFNGFLLAILQSAPFQDETWN